MRNDSILLIVVVLLLYVILQLWFVLNVSGNRITTIRCMIVVAQYG